MTRHALLLLPLLLAAAAVPAGAQQQPRDKIIQNEDAANSDAEQESGWIMNRPLPLKNNQTLRYLEPDGTYRGYAERHNLNIYFYDDKGFFIGKARRVTQAKTRYYAEDGTFLGERLHKKLTLANTTDNKDKGFIKPYVGETPLEKE